MKGFITQGVIIALGILAFGGSFLAYSQRDNIVLGQLSIFDSDQVGSSPTAGDVLQTDGTDSTWVATSTLGISGGSGDSISIDGGAVVDPDFVSTGDIDFVNTSNTVTANINSASIVEADLNINAPTDNYLMVASSTATGGFEWVATSTARLGFGTGGGSGTVTSVDMSVPTGLAISGNPITTSGTLALALDTGYVIPLTASTTDWQTAFGWGNHASAGYLTTVDISDNTNLTGDTEIVLTGDALSIASTIARDTELHSAVTLSGALDYLTLVGQDIVRGAIDLAADITGTLPVGNGGTGITSLGTGVATWLGTPSSANLATAVTGETGSGALVFGTSPAFTTGLSTPAITTASGALTVTPAAGSNFNLALSTTGDFAVNTSQLYVDTSAGNVGIGTTTPNSLLHIESTSPTMRILSSAAADAQLAFTRGSGGVNQTWAMGRDNTNGNFSIDYAASATGVLSAAPLFNIGTTGNVGIGTTNPGSIFHVEKNNTTSWATSYTAASTYAYTPYPHELTIINQEVSGTNTFAGLFFEAGEGTSNTGINSARIAAIRDGDFNTDLAFSVRSTANSNAMFEAMRIDSSGNVGIGTSTPDSRLEVQGASSGTILELVSNTGSKFLSMLNTGVTTLLGSWDFGGADFLEIPNGTNPTANDVGEIAHDTTDNQLIMDDYVFASEVPLYGFQIASTSAKFASSTSIILPPQRLGYTVTTIICSVTSGTSKIIHLFGETITCDASQEDDGTIATPTVGAASTTVPVKMGAESGSVNDVNISIFGVWTRQ